jgi:hypothetical protein
MEQLLDLIVNEELDKANELFHEIVVEKSREIYENMIAEEAEEDEEEDESVEESSEEDEEEEDESVEEGFGMDDDETSSEIGGDPADDLVHGVGDHHAMGGDDGSEMGGDEEPATKADVMDLQDALDELTREFEALMSGDGEEHDGEEHDGEEHDSEEHDGEEDGEDGEEEDESMGSVMREYRETVGHNYGSAQKTPGPIGSGTGDKAGQATETNTRSPINTNAKATMPNSKAGAHNIAQGDTGVGENTGTSPRGKVGGLVKQGGQLTAAGTKNVAGSATTKMPDGAKLSGVAKPNRTGEGQPVGAGKGELAGQTGGSTNTRSLVDRRQ